MGLRDGPLGITQSVNQLQTIHSGAKVRRVSGCKLGVLCNRYLRTQIGQSSNGCFRKILRIGLATVRNNGDGMLERKLSLLFGPRVWLITELYRISISLNVIWRTQCSSLAQFHCSIDGWMGMTARSEWLETDLVNKPAITVPAENSSFAGHRGKKPLWTFQYGGRASHPV